MGPAERERHGVSVFTLETHLLYLLEVGPRAQLAVEIRILGHDKKRLHLFLTMRQADAEPVVATAEMMILHVDMRTRRGAPFRQDVACSVARLHRAEAERPWPPQAGRAVGLRRA
jgi:acyl-CoA thioester hydrolase